MVAVQIPPINGISSFHQRSDSQIPIDCQMLKSKGRILDPYEHIFHLWKGFLLLAVEYEKPGYTENAVNEIIRSSSGFHSRTTLLRVKPTKREPEIFKIPSNGQSLDDLCGWMFRTHTPDMTKSLASIAYDDTRIILNMSHICGDGIHHARLLEHLCHPDKKRPDALLPASTHTHFKDRIFDKKWVADPTPTCSVDPKISRIISQNPVANKKVAKYFAPPVRIPIDQLACYDSSTKRCHGITESQWLANSLSNAAYVKSLTPFGCHTVVDMRRYLPEPLQNHPGIQNCISAISVHGQPSLKMRLSELAKQMRSDFKTKLDNGNAFGHMKSVWEACYRPWRAKNIPGIGMEVSSVGPVALKRPVHDATIVLYDPDAYALAGTSFLSYSLMSDEKKEFVGTFQFNSQELNEIDGHVLTRSIEHVMRDFTDNMTVGEALDDLTSFQNETRKSLLPKPCEFFTQ